MSLSHLKSSPHPTLPRSPPHWPRTRPTRAAHYTEAGAIRVQHGVLMAFVTIPPLFFFPIAPLASASFFPFTFPNPDSPGRRGLFHPPPHTHTTTSTTTTIHTHTRTHGRPPPGSACCDRIHHQTMGMAGRGRARQSAWPPPLALVCVGGCHCSVCAFGGGRSDDERAQQVGGGWPLHLAASAPQPAGATRPSPLVRPPGAGWRRRRNRRSDTGRPFQHHPSPGGRVPGLGPVVGRPSQPAARPVRGPAPWLEAGSYSSASFQQRQRHDGHPGWK